MKPYHRLTILRNRLRARDLRIFRARVERYFEQFEYDPEEVSVDWETVRSARAAINRMLPQIVQIVEAADLGGSSGAAARNASSRAAEILQNIFSEHDREGQYQEILDVIDMAIGVYDSSVFPALVRTVNPLHYVVSLLGFVAGLPRRALAALGLMGSGSARIRPGELSRLEAALFRLAGTEELIESRFAELKEWQSRMFADQTDRLLDVAERMDFVERVLAQQRAPQRIEPGKKKESTPV